MKKIKVAQIGTSGNSHGQSIFASMAKQSDIFEIVGYALPENEREKFPNRMEVFNGYKEMTVDEILNDPEIEAVAVETEEIYLTKYATLVAKSGKHMHMEKPGGTNLADFENMINIMKKSGKVFHTGYMYRYNPAVMKVKELVKSGKLGEIYSVETHMDCIHPTDVRQWLENFPGGMLFFLGCHLIDLIFSIQGTPEEIIPMSMATGIDGVTAKDYGMAVFKYKNGISFAKTSASEPGGFLRRQLVVCGSKGTIELKPLEAYDEKGLVMTSMFEYYSEKDTDWGRKWDESESPHADRYDNMMRGFASYVRGEKENPWNYDYELELYKIILKACGEKA